MAFKHDALLASLLLMARELVLLVCVFLIPLMVMSVLVGIRTLTPNVAVMVLSSQATLELWAIAATVNLG